MTLKRASSRLQRETSEGGEGGERWGWQGGTEEGKDMGKYFSAIAVLPRDPLTGRLGLVTVELCG